MKKAVHLFKSSLLLFVGIWVFTMPWADRLMAATFCVDTSGELQSALTTAQSNGEDDVIQIQQGAYSGNFVYSSGEAFAITMDGGYLDGCTSREMDPANTVLDGGSMGAVLVIDNSHDSVQFDISGVTIQYGSGTGWDGGGLSITGISSSTVSHCAFTNNDSPNDGGGISLWESYATISNCSFLNNSSDAGGGAIAVMIDADADITDCLFDGNESYSGGAVEISWNAFASINNSEFVNNTAEYGGAIHNHYGFHDLYRSTFYGNSANIDGGAMFNFAADGPIVNCTFADNTAGSGGGAMWSNPADGPPWSPTITNCSFWRNTAGEYGGGIMNTYDENWPLFDYPITNSIFWENKAPVGAQIYNENDIAPKVMYCNIDGGYTGEGNIDADPLFADPDGYDFHLMAASPCIDTGTAADAPDADFDGDPRPYGAGYDMGADEWVVTDSDGDGLSDAEDACPLSDLNDTVVIDGEDSGVENLMLEEGCTISDQISQCAQDASCHGAFLLCTYQTTCSLKKEKIISRRDQKEIMRCARRADIP